MSTHLPSVRLPSKSLKDIELDEKLYKADFELSLRYDATAKEIQRLALLGIGAYGFFVTKAGMDKTGDPTQALLGFVRHPMFPIAGLLAFALSAGCAVSCGYLNSRCLKLQIDILRLIGRNGKGIRVVAPRKRVRVTRSWSMGHALQVSSLSVECSARLSNAVQSFRLASLRFAAAWSPP